MKVKYLLGTIGVTCVIANASYADEDPYQTYNRHAFAMNQQVDKAILRPVATAYKDVMPNYARQRVSAFFDNLGTLPIAVNDFLEAKFYEGSCNLWRFFFNSTVGVAGLYDVATSMGLPATSADFGMTLAQWGYDNTHYLVIPFLGPSTVRDAIGTGVDHTTLSVYPYIDDVSVRNSLEVTNLIQLRAQLLDFQTLSDQAAVDPYIFERNAYLQRRNYVLTQNIANYKASQGSSPSQSQDPFVDE